MAKSPLYDGKRSGEKKEPAKEPAKEPDKKPAESNAEGQAASDAKGDDEPEKGAAFLEALKGLHGKHEAERRDFHGNQREMLRQMAARHAKDFKDHFAQQTAAEGQGEEGGGAAAAPAAGGAAEE